MTIQLVNAGVITEEGRKLLLNLLLAGGDPPDAWNLLLYKTTLDPQATTPYAGFAAAPPGYTTYAQQPTTMSTVMTTDGGVVQIVGSNEFFSVTTGTVNEDVRGVALVHHVDGAPGVDTVVQFWNFAVPIAIGATAGQFIGFKPTVGLGPDGSEGLVET